MVRMLHLPRYFPHATRRLHITLSRRLKLRGPIDGRSFSPSFVNNGHFIKTLKAEHNDIISHVTNACYNSSPNVSLRKRDFKIKRRSVRWYWRTCNKPEMDHKRLHCFSRKISREKYQEPECRWRDNNQMNLKRKLLNDAHWIRLDQDMYQEPAVVNTGMKFRVLHDTNRSTWIAEQLSEFLVRLFQVVSRLLR